MATTQADDDEATNERHTAESRRVEVLSGFLTRFAPAIGEKVAEGFQGTADDEAGTCIVGARNAAILAAFGAIERIAKGS